MADMVTISPCPACGGSGYGEHIASPYELGWHACPDCAGSGEHICECRVDLDCIVHGSDSVRVEVTPETIAQMAAQRGVES